MDPCDTLAFTGNHSDIWPFSTTLWDLVVKKILLSLSNASEIPVDLSPSCHTLSKALNIWKITPQDSRVGDAFKAV